MSCTAGDATTSTLPRHPTTTDSTPVASTTTLDSSTLPRASTTVTTLLPAFSWSIRPVDETFLAHSWMPGCPRGPDDLVVVELTHFDFEGSMATGEIVVAGEHADGVVLVFADLFAAGYPIESMTPIGHLPEDAEEEPGYSNTSGFHCRLVAGTTRWSEHALGSAIDINPHLNPFVRGEEVWPEDSEPYLDRTLDLPGLITEGDVVVTAFDAIGWEWGGRWRTLKDYHHFSASGR